MCFSFYFLNSFPQSVTDLQQIRDTFTVRNLCGYFHAHTEQWGQFYRAKMQDGCKYFYSFCLVNNLSLYLNEVSKQTQLTNSLQWGRRAEKEGAEYGVGVGFWERKLVFFPSLFFSFFIHKYILTNVRRFVGSKNMRKLITNCM